MLRNLLKIFKANLSHLKRETKAKKKDEEFNYYLGVVHKWRQEILNIFRHPSPIVTRFITEALLLLSQNPWPLPHKTVTSFIDGPLRVHVCVHLYKCV